MPFWEDLAYLTNDTLVCYTTGMIAAFVYRLYPTKEQERALWETLETLRHLYSATC